MTTGLLANRVFTLADLHLTPGQPIPGQPIPAETWESVPERNRQAMVNTKFVILAGQYAGPEWAPVRQTVTQPRTARKKRARKA